MNSVQQIIVASNDDDQRLDRFLKRKFPQLKQGMIEKMCRKGELRIDGKRCKANDRVFTDNSVRVPPLPSQKAPLVKRTNISEKDAEWVRSLVIYRDPDLLVINKPFGIAVQGGTKTTRHIDGLSEALQFNKPTKPHLVHRLDRDTTGTLIMGRHPKAAATLAKLFQTRFVEKVYWAVVAGQPQQKLGRINFGIQKTAGHGKQGQGEKMIALHPKDIKDSEGAKKALTDYMIMENAGGRVTWLAMSPRTGRTHQLRVHASAIGHPIIGDRKYGSAQQENRGDGWGAGIGGEIAPKLHLHARSLSFEHPFQGSRFFIAAEIPPHMSNTWSLMGWENGLDADKRWEEISSGLAK